MQLVVRWNLQVIQLYSGINHSQFAARDPDDVGRESFWAIAVKNRFRVRVAKAPDHRVISERLNVSFHDTFRNQKYREMILSDLIN
jgi:hypothetical protein